MDINDFFGENPLRPDHDDFWKLSEIVLSLDATAEEEGAAGIERIMADIGVDPQSLAYMSFQRCLRQVERANRGASTKQKIERALALGAIYVEAFAVGFKYANEILRHDTCPR